MYIFLTYFLNNSVKHKITKHMSRFIFKGLKATTTKHRCGILSVRCSAEATADAPPRPVVGLSLQGWDVAGDGAAAGEPHL